MCILLIHTAINKNILSAFFVFIVFVARHSNVHRGQQMYEADTMDTICAILLGNYLLRKRH